MRLFLASRRVIAITIAIVVVSALGAVSQGLKMGPIGRSGDLRFPAVLAVPAVIAALVAAVCGSPAPVREAAAAKRIRRFRMLSLGIGVAVASSSIAATIPPLGAFGLAAAERNFAGFLGIALIGAFAVGPRLAWLPVLVAIGLPPFFFANRADDPVGILTFYARPASTASSALYAVALLVVGIIVVGVRTPRDRIATRTR